MKVTIQKGGQVRARWTQTERFDVIFPVKTWNHIQIWVRKNDWTKIILWCIQNGIMLEAMKRITSLGPKKARRTR